MGKIVMQPQSSLSLTPTTPLTTSSAAQTTTVSPSKPKVDGLSIASIVVLLLMFIGGGLFAYYQWKVLLSLVGVRK